MSDDEWLDLWKFAKKHIEPASSRRLARAAWEWVTHGYQRAARGELTAAEYAKAESTVDRDGHVAAFAEKSFLGGSPARRKESPDPGGDRPAAARSRSQDASGDPGGSCRRRSPLRCVRAATKSRPSAAASASPLAPMSWPRSRLI